MYFAILNIIPTHYRSKLWLSIALSFVNLVLDFISIVVLVPVFAGLLNPGFSVGISNQNIVALLNYVGTNREIFIAGILLFFVGKNVLSVRIMRFQAQYCYGISNALSVDLLRNFFNKPYVDVKSDKNSALVKDIVFIPNNFVTYVLSAALQLISEAMLLAMVVVASMLINLEVTLFFSVVVAIIVTSLYWYEKNMLKTINQNSNENYNSTIATLMNAVNGYAEIKIGRLENYFVAQFGNSNVALNKIYSRLTADRLAKPKYTETFLVVLISALFLFLGYFSPNYNILFLSFLFAACIKIIPSVNRILIATTNIRANLYTIDILESRLFDKHVAETKTKSGVRFHETLSLNEITFKYIDSPLLLDRVSLTVAKGSIIGIYGGSGGGKSTLANLVTTLITPVSGSMAIDGVKISDANKTSYLELLGYVPQSPFILEGTILENLLLGKNAEPEIVNRYLDLFGLSETIDALPLRKATFIGSNGYSLSGGQLQRIAIIRALLRNPEILILDEATNQLDATLRIEVTSVLKDIARTKNLTIIMISHNVDELERFCDSIYKLKNSVLIQKK